MKYRLLYSIILLLMLVTTAFSSSITYEYDHLDRLVVVRYSAYSWLEYKYDEIGNMIDKIYHGYYSLTASAGTNGAISPASASVYYGGSQTFTITPSTGYQVADIIDNGVSKGAVTSYTLSDVSAPHTISATFTMNSYTITATAGSGGTISPSVPITLNYNSSQGYTITPSTGYHTTDVVVDGHSLGPLPNYGFLNVASNHSISAGFAINQYPVTFTAGPNGSLTGTTSQIVDYGGSTTAVTAVPAAGGNYFVNWTGSNGFVTTTSNPLIVSNVTTGQNITANFRAPDPVIPPDLIMNPSYNLMIPATIFPGQKYYIDATAINLGTVAPGSFDVKIYLSTDSTISNNDIVLGTVPGGASSYLITIPANVAKGQYYVVAMADATYAVAESDETNNTYVYNYGNPVTVSDAGDLAVTSLISPAHANLNKEFLVQVTIKNQGSTKLTGINVELYGSMDTTITGDFTSDFYLNQYQYVESLTVGGEDDSKTLNFMVSTDSAHVWPYIGVKAYTYSLDSDNTNNTKANAIMFHNDLTPPTSTASPAGGAYGTAQIVSLTCNDGAGAGCDKIYYTTDGSVPTTSSSVYTAPLSVPATTTVKYFAIDLVENKEIVVNSQTYAVSYTITATGGSNGSISPSSATVNYGGSQTFTITPAMNYHIADVLVDGVSKGAIGSYSFTNISAPHTISASFAINTFTITATAGSNGTISPSSATVNFGGSQTFTITPATGYHVADIVIDGVSMGASNSYSFSNVTVTHSITASFAINTYTVTVSAGSNGAISPSSATINYGGSQTFTITPATGYLVADVTVDGVSQGAVNSISITNIAAGHTIAARFVFNPTTCVNQPVRISRTPTIFYTSLQAAYDAAITGDVIQTQSQLLTGNLNANRDISVTIDGGYSCNYASNPDVTYLLGSATLNSGMVTMKNIQLQK
jgi:hypothetical protein